MIWQFIGRIFHSLFCLIRWRHQHVGRSLIIWSDLCLLNVHPDIDHCWNVALNCWLLAINGGVEWVSSFLKVYQYRWGYSVPLKVYLTLPYHMGKTLYHLVLRWNGPNAHPRINRKVTKSPSAVLTWVHTKMWNHPPPKWGPTHFDLPANTHSQYLQENVSLKAHPCWSPWPAKLLTRKIQETHLRIEHKATKSPSAILTWVTPNWNHINLVTMTSKPIKSTNCFFFNSTK